MIATMLLTSQLFNFTVCVMLAVYKRHPIVLWALLGAGIPVSAPLVIALAPRLGSRRSSASAPPLMGWILLAAGALSAPQMLIGMGFSVNSSQLRTSLVLLLLSVGAMVAGAALLRQRSFASAPMPAASERALHGIAAVAVVISNGFGIWTQLLALAQRGLDGLSSMWISLLPIVVAVYLLQGRRFARPLLIALSIYALAPGFALMMGPLGRAPLAWNDTRTVVETSAKLVALTSLVIAALLAHARRRDSSNRGGMALESAT